MNTYKKVIGLIPSRLESKRLKKKTIIVIRWLTINSAYLQKIPFIKKNR